MAHIAIIDDDASVRQSLHRLIKSVGYEASSYPTAEAFLRSPGLGEADCLILDIQMPGLSGLDLQGIVGALRQPIPIVFITAHNDNETRSRAFAHGAVGFLEKPFDDQALIDLLEEAIQKSAHPKKPI